MSPSGSGQLDLVLEGVEFLFQRKADQRVLVPKWHSILNRVDPSYVNSITGSDYRAKCSNILHDITPIGVQAWELSLKAYATRQSLSSLLYFTPIHNSTFNIQNLTLFLPYSHSFQTIHSCINNCSMWFRLSTWIVKNIYKHCIIYHKLKF
jgi:hypothetical protein